MRRSRLLTSTSFFGLFHGMWHQPVIQEGQVVERDPDGWPIGRTTTDSDRRRSIDIFAKSLGLTLGQ